MANRGNQHISHGFSWHGASRGPSAIAELLVLKLTVKKHYVDQVRQKIHGTFLWPMVYWCELLYESWRAAVTWSVHPSGLLLLGLWSNNRVANVQAFLVEYLTNNL